MMVSIVHSQQEALLSPTGTSVWSGQVVQALNSEAVMWSLSTELCGPGGPYFIIPLSVEIGNVVTVLHWLLSRVSDLLVTDFQSVTDNTVEVTEDWSSQG